MDSPFEILGIEPDADDEAIDRAYRRRAKETHPDRGGSAQEFLEVRAAYEAILTGHGLDVGEGESTTDRPRPRRSEVEYLDYEVLDDYGWNLDDDELFEKAAAEGLDSPEHGKLTVQPDESLLEAAERCGFAWPFACRGGACANCAVAMTEGELSMPVNQILPPAMLDRGIRLSCVGAPLTEEARVVYNVKHLPDLDELRLPPRPFEQARADD